jgi:hypothetical protein
LTHRQPHARAIRFSPLHILMSKHGLFPGPHFLLPLPPPHPL